MKSVSTVYNIWNGFNIAVNWFLLSIFLIHVSITMRLCLTDVKNTNCATSLPSILYSVIFSSIYIFYLHITKFNYFQSNIYSNKQVKDNFRKCYCRIKILYEISKIRILLLSKNYCCNTTAYCHPKNSFSENSCIGWKVRKELFLKQFLWG